MPQAIRWKLLPLAFVLALGAAACAEPPTATVNLGTGVRFLPEVGDSLNDAGRYPSIVTNADGLPVVAYFGFEEKLEAGAVPVTRPVGSPSIPGVLLATVSQQGFWTPTPSDVRGLEARLPTYLRSPKARKAAAYCCPQPVPLATRAPSYKRQYVGVLDHGRRLIHASFFCEASGSDWHRTPVDVDDGGDCYFQIDYDVRKRRFESISVNGGA